MLCAYPAPHAQGATLKNATWVDLLDPTEAERTAFQEAFGLRVPTRDELSEIEATSRLRIEGDGLYMTAPLIFVPPEGPWIVTPTGFVLSKHVLLTVRFEKLPAFEAAGAEFGPKDLVKPIAVFVRLLECLVDRVADRLEANASDLDDAAHLIFQSEHAKLAQETGKLRRLMLHTGRVSERMARVQYALVCLDRIAKFAAEHAHDWIERDMTHRLGTVSSDISSLLQFIEGLVSRVQLLQDAAAGLINIDQNEVMKVLTIASVVGIPPVLVAGIYGMNFKYMPEYDWTYGYPYALAVIVVTALLPLLWFKWKNWI
jgi:magnesium transporter